MDGFSQILMYVLTLTLAAFLPGPGMTGLMFNTLIKGHRYGLLMLAGLITGDLSYLLISLWCMSYSFGMNSYFSIFILGISSLYLFYLAYQYWHFKGNLLETSTQHSTLHFNQLDAYRNGLLITLSNPKTISFYFTLIPAIFGVHRLQHQTLIIVIFTILVLISVGAVYIFCVWRLKSILRKRTLQHLLIKFFAIVMFLLAFSLWVKVFAYLI